MATWEAYLSGGKGYKLIYNVNERIPSDYIATNRTYVDWSVELEKTSGSGYWDYTRENPVRVYLMGNLAYEDYISYDFRSTSRTTVATGTFEIYHNSDGSKTINISSYFSDVSNGLGDAWAGGDMTLTTIPRYAVTNSVSGSDIENPFSVNYTKYVTSYKYKLRVGFTDGVFLKRIDYNTSGQSFNLTPEEIETIYNKYPDTNNFQLTFGVETYDSSGTTVLSYGNYIYQNCTKQDRAVRIRINGEWKRATPYVRVNGQWKKATPYIRNNNEWKRGK